MADLTYTQSAEPVSITDESTGNQASVSATGAVKVDGSAVTQPVSATSLPLPTGAATSALQTQPGVDIGDVTVNNASGASAVNIQDGGNSITVDGAVTANIGTTNGLALETSLVKLPLAQASTTSGQSGPLVQGAVTTANPTYVTGQTDPISLTTAGALRTDNTSWLGSTAPTVGSKTSANSVPVVIASDQAPLPTNTVNQTGSGTITALNGTVVTSVTDGDSTLGFSITGTWVGTVVIELSNDGGVSWTASSFVMESSDLLASSTTTNGQGYAPIGGFGQMRFRASAFTSGTISIAWILSDGVNTVQVFNTNALNLNAQVVGNVASATTDSGNPVKIGAVYNTTLPTVTTGQRVDLQADANGRLITVAETPFSSLSPTYSAAVNQLVLAATATDIFTITGSATKTIRILNIEITGFQTTASHENFLIIKRSTANTGGTSTTPTVVPHDSTDAAGTAVVRAYTANPTALGTTVGTIKAGATMINTTAGVNGNPSVPLTFNFNDGVMKPPTLRGTSQVLAINFAGGTATGSTMSFSFTWIEE